MGGNTSGKIGSYFSFTPKLINFPTHHQFLIHISILFRNDCMFAVHYSNKHDNMTSKDLLWKGIIEECIEMFLEFFFPNDFHQFDLTKPVEFLEQELQKLYPEGESIDRRLDKLCKVHLKNGTVRWILIHIEVQGYLDKLFAKRMFQYFYRSFDRFDVPIAAFAIFTDGDKYFHPKSFEMELLGTKQTYTFNTYKVLEHTEEELLISDNPFAMVVLTVLKAIKGGTYNREQLYSLKWSIAKR